jgi:hypothetical protein
MNYAIIDIVNCKFRFNHGLGKPILEISRTGGGYSSNILLELRTERATNSYYFPR